MSEAHAVKALCGFCLHYHPVCVRCYPVSVVSSRQALDQLLREWRVELVCHWLGNRAVNYAHCEACHDRQIEG